MTDPQFPLARLALAYSYLAKHQYEAAVEEAKNGMQVSGAGPDIEANLAATYAVAGQAAQARDLLSQLKAESEREHPGLFFTPVAQVYAALGEKDKAFVWLEKDFQYRNGGLTLIKVLPFLNSLHGDPRFADLVRRIGLPP